MDTNEELRTVFFTTILSAKYAAVADRFYDDGKTDGSKSERLVETWNGLNDFYAALMSNMAVRLVMGPINDTADYVTFMDANGKEVTAGRMVEAWTWNQVSAITRAFFKESRALDPFMEGLAAAAAGHDNKVVWETFRTQWEKLGQSSTRF